MSFAGTRLLVFGMTVALARLLAPAEFGVVASGMAIIVFLEIGLDVGLGASLIYEQERGISRRVQTAFTVNFIVAGAMTIFAMLAAPTVARLFHAADQVGLYRTLFTYLLIRGAAQVPDAILKRDLGFRQRAGVDLARVSVRVASALLLAVAGAGAWSIVLSLLLGEIVGVVLSWWVVKFCPTFALDRAAINQLLHFGLAAFAIKLVDAAALDSDYLVVGARLGPTDLGYYTIGYRLPELLLFNVYWMFSTIAFPIYARYRDQGGDALARVMLRVLRAITLFSFPAGVGLALVARDAILVLFGPRWSPAAFPMALIALTTALASVGYASGDIFLATGKPGILLGLNVPLTAALVVAMVVVAPAGIAAVAAIHLAAASIEAPARLFLANRQVGTTIGADLAAMRPGVTATLGVLVCAGPLRLLMPPGLGTLTATVAAGVVGALSATWILERATMLEAYGLLKGQLAR